ncbi:hypothetical protein SAMN05421787_107171 [Virgibacillus pantothenticus]|nr:hypothetical protein SAMN05421787_107171 [Virgibacillus pantothenticus]
MHLQILSKRQVFLDFSAEIKEKKGKGPCGRKVLFSYLQQGY